MSGTASHRPARDPPGDSAPRPAAHGLLTPVNVVIAVATLAAFALRADQLSSPSYLLGVTQYDDGVYFGSAVRLVHGVLPYRDFAMVQPPGIILLMVPAALLSRATGTAVGMAAGRIMTALASTASVTLAGLLVRHRGVLAAAVATGIMAVYPVNLEAAHTVLVEPWLVLFILAAAVAVFDGDRLSASGRRLAGGGVAAGFAGAVEAWAIFPVLVIFALAALASPPPARFRRAGTFAAGVLAGFCVPVLPFAVLAPRGFYQSVVSSQAGRVVRAATPFWFRLRLMTGVGQQLALGNAAVLAVSLAVVAVIVAATVTAWLLAGRPPPALDWFAVVTTAAVVAAFLSYPQFFWHFPAFLAPFLSLALALPSARVMAAVRERRARPQPARQGGWLPAGAAVLAILACSAAQLGLVSNVRPVVSPADIAAARRIIPPGACVVTDQASYLIAADRFISSVPGCSEMVDALATDYALGHGRDGNTGAGRVPAVAAFWRSAFTHAGYAWLTIGYDRRRVAWTPRLREYFRHNFVRVYRGARRDVIYARSG